MYIIITVGKRAESLDSGCSYEMESDFENVKQVPWMLIEVCCFCPFCVVAIFAACLWFWVCGGSVKGRPLKSSLALSSSIKTQAQRFKMKCTVKGTVNRRHLRRWLFRELRVEELDKAPPPSPQRPNAHAAKMWVCSRFVKKKFNIVITSFFPHFTMTWKWKKKCWFPPPLLLLRRFSHQSTFRSLRN